MSASAQVRFVVRNVQALDNALTRIDDVLVALREHDCESFCGREHETEATVQTAWNAYASDALSPIYDLLESTRYCSPQEAAERIERAMDLLVAEGAKP